MLYLHYGISCLEATFSFAMEGHREEVDVVVVYSLLPWSVYEKKALGFGLDAYTWDWLLSLQSNSGHVTIFTYLGTFALYILVSIL